MNPIRCTHPPRRLYAWNVDESNTETPREPAKTFKERYERTLVVVCCECGKVLKGGCE